VAAADAPVTVHRFDAVVLTCPVPQVLALDGDVGALLEGAEILPGLRAVAYSSRYSLVLYFGPGDWAAVSRALPYAGRYVGRAENEVLRYVSYDSRKRGVAGAAAGDEAAGAGAGADAEACPSVVIHTSVEFGAMYLETAPALVEPVILEHVRRLLPDLPTPVETKCHRWRYSQVTRGYAGPVPFAALAGAPADACAGGDAPPARAVLAVDDPPLVLAGDAFTASNFDGCAESAAAAADLLQRCWAAHARAEADKGDQR
jgi:renalase